MASPSGSVRNFCRCAVAAMTAPISASTPSIRCRAISSPSRRMASRRAIPTRRPCPAMSRSHGARLRTSRPTRSRSASSRWGRPPCRGSSTCRFAATVPTRNSASILRRISPRSAVAISREPISSGFAPSMTTNGAGCACRSPIFRCRPSKSRRGCVSPSPRSRRPSLSAVRKSASKGVKDEKFVTLASGATDASGFFSWTPDKRGGGEARRIVVNKGLDTLVVDPDSAPSEYSREIWSKPESEWLAWTSEADQPRAEKPRTLCHVFSERPIYRPEESAHIKGFVRSYRGGALSLTKTGGTLVVTGPGNQEWRIPVKLDASRRLLSQIRRANSGDRRLFGAVRTGCAEKGEEAGSAEERNGRSGRGRERSGRARSRHFLRPVHLQERSLSSADF